MELEGGQLKWRERRVEECVCSGKIQLVLQSPLQKLTNTGAFYSNDLDSNGKSTAFQVTFDNAAYSNGKSSTQPCQQRGGGSACPSVSLTGLGILFPRIFPSFFADSAKCLHEANA